MDRYRAPRIMRSTQQLFTTCPSIVLPLDEDRSNLLQLHLLPTSYFCSVDCCVDTATAHVTFGGWCPYFISSVCTSRHLQTVWPMLLSVIYASPSLIYLLLGLLFHLFHHKNGIRLSRRAPFLRNFKSPLTVVSVHSEQSFVHSE